jgi:GTP cyclohydrolase I
MMQDPNRAWRRLSCQIEMTGDLADALDEDLRMTRVAIATAGAHSDQLSV